MYRNSELYLSGQLFILFLDIWYTFILPTKCFALKFNLTNMDITMPSSLFKKKPVTWDLIFLNISFCSRKFPSKHYLAPSHKFWYVVFLFSFTSQYFLIFLVILSLPVGYLGVCFLISKYLWVSWIPEFPSIDFYFHCFLFREHFSYDFNLLKFIYASHAFYSKHILCYYFFLKFWCFLYKGLT